MKFRRLVVLLFGSLLLLSGLTARPLSAAPAAEMLARVHWLGLKQISTDTNAVHFMSVWQMPQTVALVAQTLDKISRRPAGGATNAASALLRPLLDDLVTTESCLEVYAPTGSQPATFNSQLFLALRLPSDRARLWQTNLAAALETLTGNRPVLTGDGWLLRQSHAPEWIEFFHSGQWTLVGLGADTNLLRSDFATRIARRPAPSATNFWLEADLAPSRLVDDGFLSTLHFPSSFSNNRLHLAVTAESGDVLTRATLNFSRPLDLHLSPWEIPTNLINQPLTSFTAMRGLAAWLAASPAWQKLHLTPPPDQAFVWAQSGVPFQTYFAAPLPAASNQLCQLAARLVQNANPWLATNAEGNFQWQMNPPGIVWNNAVLITPFLAPISEKQHDYLLGGLYSLTAGDSGPPAEILRPLLGTPNLVYYHAEQTDVRLEDGLFITQLFRVIFHKAQLPVNAVATQWLKQVEPLMGGNTTSVTLTAADQLTFTRRSTVGFTALELHLLADWLESPQFPHGLHTLLAQPEKQR